MEKLNKYLIFLLLGLFSIILPQTNSSLKVKEDEKEKLRNEIKQLEETLIQKAAYERNSLKTIENYKRQGFLINKLIVQLKKEEKEKSFQIFSTLQNIKKTENEISRLKENYSKYIVWLYKNGSNHEWNYLFSAENINQALNRLTYLNKISEQKRKELTDLKLKKNNLVTLTKQLENEKAEKSQLLLAKGDEENKLQIRLTSLQDIIQEVRTDKEELEKEMMTKRKAEEEISQLITKLITEQKRKVFEKQFKEKEGKVITEYDYDNFESFQDLRGRLTWPLTGGKVVRKFGENHNSKLKTITLNYGVDIKAAGDLNVMNVAEGIVSVIDWIPGYGTVIIVSHKNNFRTVYGHISKVFVSEGDKIKRGTVIGTVAESLEGTILHFEIWNERNHQNPESWLAKK